MSGEYREGANETICAECRFAIVQIQGAWVHVLPWIDRTNPHQAEPVNEVVL